MKRAVGWVLVMAASMPVFSEDTELNFYRPLNDTLKHPPIINAPTKTGDCWQQSKLIKREDAWRCKADGAVYDPCFVQLYGAHLEAICPESPWSNRGVKITVAAPLNNNHHEPLDMSRTLPWALELASGERCQAIDTNEQFDGLPVRYRCEQQSALIGHVQRCESMWKILQHAQNKVDTVKIAKAWF